MTTALALAASVVLLSGPDIRVGDVAPGASGPLARVAIARLPADRAEVTLSPAALARLVRRAAPGQSLAVHGPITFRRSLSRAVASTPAVPPAPDVAPGAALTLTSTSGPVRVERTVTALQPGRLGGRLFVRAADGQVFAAPLAGARP